MAKQLLGKEVNEALVAALQTRTAALKEKGVPVVNSRRRGDQRFTVVVETPTKLTKEQKELLRKLEDGEAVTPKRKKFFDVVKDFFD